MNNCEYELIKKSIVLNNELEGENKMLKEENKRLEQINKIIDNTDLKTFDQMFSVTKQILAITLELVAEIEDLKDKQSENIQNSMDYSLHRYQIKAILATVKEIKTEGLKLTLNEIGKHMGLTKERIRQILEKDGKKISDLKGVLK